MRIQPSSRSNAALNRDWLTAGLRPLPASLSSVRIIDNTHLTPITAFLNIDGGIRINNLKALHVKANDNILLAS
jgi:hypothetical protein